MHFIVLFLTTFYNYDFALPWLELVDPLDANIQIMYLQMS